MNSPPAVRPRIADTSAQPAVDVRLDGRLIKRIAPAAAEQLIARGWAEWRRTGRRRYISLTPEAPVSFLHGWGSRDGTRPIRADGSGQRAAGQVLGHRASHLEHTQTRI